MSDAASVSVDDPFNIGDASRCGSLTDAESFVQSFKDEVRASGGVMKYLLKNVVTVEDHAEFEKDLYELIPEEPNVEYTNTLPIEGVAPGKESTIKASTIHLSKFAFGPNVSLQLEPEIHTTEKLVDRYHVEGFLTENGHIIVCIPSNVAGPLKAFSVHYIKGQGRINTLLALAHYMIRHNVKMGEPLKNTAAQINCKHVLCIDRKAELFYAFSQSYRDAIRKAPTAAMWCGSLLKLGGSESNLVKAWNETCPRSDRIQGFKAVAIKTLLALPPPVLQLILETNSKLGSNSPWADENMASKKLALRASFKTQRTPSSSPWAKRGLVTESSLLLLVNNITSSPWDSKGRAARPSKADVEAKLEMCTLAAWLATEAEQLMPLPATMMKDKFLDKVASADPVVEVELMSALQIKDDSYKVRDNPTIASILNDNALNVSSGVASASSAQAQMDAEQATIDKDEFELGKKEIIFDQKTYDVWLVKVGSHLTAVSHQKDVWRINVIQENKRAVENYLLKQAAFPIYNESVEKVASDAISQYKDMKSSIARQMKIDPASIVTICLVNWSTPCMIASAQQTAQVQLLNFIMAEDSESIGASLNPVFSYTRGQVWLQEHALMKTCATAGNLNVDKFFALSLKDKRDARDSRPMMHPGRILSQSRVDVADMKIWKKSRLVTNMRTDPVPMLCPKDMDIVEGVSDMSLPSQTDLGYPSGSKKFSQLGEPAWTELLSSLLDGSSMNSKQAVLVVNLNCTWPAEFLAFVTCQQTHKLPFFSLNFCCDMAHYEWLHAVILERLCQRFQDGTLKITGGEPKDLNPPAEHIEGPPAKPHLKKLVWSSALKDNDNKYTPKIAFGKDIIKKWQHHPTFGMEFRKIMDEHHEKYGIVTADDEADDKEQGKRAATTASGSQPKKVKIEDAGIEGSFVKVSDISEVELVSFPLGNLKVAGGADTCILTHRTDGCTYVVNSSADKPCMITRGSMLVGFGKISFQSLNNEEEVGEKDIAFRLTSSTNLVMLANGEGFHEVCALIRDAKQKGKDGAKVCYHEMVQDLWISM